MSENLEESARKVIVTHVEKIVLVQSVDEPARQPFQRQVRLDIPIEDRIPEREVIKQTPPLEVPSGKRLVIEYITAVPDRGWKKSFPLLSISTTVSGNTVNYPLILKAGHENETRIEQLMRIYADAGESVTFHVHVGSQPDPPLEGIKFGLSGYLVDIK